MKTHFHHGFRVVGRTRRRFTRGYNPQPLRGKKRLHSDGIRKNSLPHRQVSGFRLNKRYILRGHEPGSMFPGIAFSLQ